MGPKAAEVSLALQSIASALSEGLESIVGEPLAFVLMVSVDNTVQYVSNAKREEGTDLIKSLLARWEANRADIPAHYNPDLKMPDWKVIVYREGAGIVGEKYVARWLEAEDYLKGLKQKADGRYGTSTRTQPSTDKGADWGEV